MDGVRQHAAANAVLYHAAQALGEDLCAASCDYEGYYNQFHQAISEWCHSCIALISPEGELHFFMSKVLQFGRSYGPAVGQRLMECICDGG